MAKIKMSPLATDIAGSVDGLLFSKSRGIHTVRKKVIPANPNTSGQRVSRESLAQLMFIYANFSLWLRNGWDASAIGQPATPINLYLKQCLSAYRGVADFSLASASAVPIVTGSQGAPDLDTNPIEIVFSPSPIPAGYGLTVLTTTPIDDDLSTVEISFTNFSAGQTSPKTVPVPPLSGHDVRAYTNFWKSALALYGYGSSFIVNFL